MQLIAQVPVLGASDGDGTIVRHTHRGLVWHRAARRVSPLEMRKYQLTQGHQRLMKFPADLVPQKVVASDLCVSLVTLWRARQSDIPGFPQPVVIRKMIFWRKDDVQQLEDALMQFEGRGRFEADRLRAKRTMSVEKAMSKVKRLKRRQRRSDERQLPLF